MEILLEQGRLVRAPMGRWMCSCAGCVQLGMAGVCLLPGIVDRILAGGSIRRRDGEGNRKFQHPAGWLVSRIVRGGGGMDGARVEWILFRKAGDGRGRVNGNLCRCGPRASRFALGQALQLAGAIRRDRGEPGDRVTAAEAVRKSRGGRSRLAAGCGARAPANRRCATTVRSGVWRRVAATSLSVLQHSVA